MSTCEQKQKWSRNHKWETVNHGLHGRTGRDFHANPSDGAKASFTNALAPPRLLVVDLLFVVSSHPLRLEHFIFSLIWRRDLLLLLVEVPFLQQEFRKNVGELQQPRIWICWRICTGKFSSIGNFSFHSPRLGFSFAVHWHWVDHFFPHILLHS